jgi:hypothetical protein
MTLHCKPKTTEMKLAINLNKLHSNPKRTKMNDTNEWYEWMCRFDKIKGQRNRDNIS